MRFLLSFTMIAVFSFCSFWKEFKIVHGGVLPAVLAAFQEESSLTSHVGSKVGKEKEWLVCETGCGLTCKKQDAAFSLNCTIYTNKK